LPPAAAPRFACVYADTALMRGLGTWDRAQVAAPPADARALLAGGLCAGESLLLLDELRSPAAYGDARACCRVLERYERDWFAPLLAALARARVSRLDLVAGDGWLYRVGRFDSWCAWRRQHAWHRVVRSRARPHVQ
jgi:hypothetical protein